MNDLFNGKTKEVLNILGIEYQEKGRELLSSCIFNDCDSKRKNSRHLYINSETGQYDCKKCGESGNLWSLCAHFKMSKDEIVKKFSVRNTSYAKLSIKNKLSEKAKQYLNQRGISDASIRDAGIYEEKNKIMIPVRNESLKTLYCKKRTYLSSDKSPKSMLEKGAKQSLYGLEFKNKWKEDLFICEGEMDYLLLLSEGIEAISPTNGAKQKLNEYVQNFYSIRRIYVCYDVFEKGADKVLSDLLKIFPAKEIYKIYLPESLGEGGDITDFWKQKDLWKGKDFKVALIDHAHLVDLSADEKIVKIADLKPKTTYQDLIAQIEDSSGGEYAETFEIVFASIMSVFLPSNLDPLWILMVAPPSSGKTQMLNLFQGISWIKRLDNITPKAFISGHADKKMQNDLLKELDQSCLIIKDYSSAFSKSEETLKELLGDLTNIYDGEFSKHSSGRGTIAYNSYFSHIGAITPQTLKKREGYLSVLGARFLHIKLPDHNEAKQADIMLQIINGDKSRETEKQLKKNIASHAQYWKHHLKRANTISFEDEALKKELLLIAKFISHSRGVLSYPDYREKLPYEIQDHQIEKPYRVLSQLTKLLQTITIFRGKDVIGRSEFNIIKRIALHCMPLDRAEIIELILGQNFLGVTDVICAQNSKKSAKTFSRRLKELAYLDILEVQSDQPKHHYRLKNEYQKLFESFTPKGQGKLIL